MLSKYKIIANPITRKVKQKLAQLEKVFKENGVSYDIYFTTGPRDAEVMTREFVEDGWETFVVIGGDGTVSEVMNGVYRARRFTNLDCKIGIIPTGSANDFALELGIPLDAEKGALRLVKSEYKELDLVEAEYGNYKRLIHVDAGLGMTSEGLRRLHVKSRWLPGPLMYITLAFKVVFGYRNKLVHYSMDGEKLGAKTTVLIVSSGKFYLGFKNFRPDAKENDGIFEITILHDMNWLETLGAIVDLIRGRLMKNKKVICKQARELQVTADPPLGMNIDGDLRGFLPVKFSVKPKVLKIIV